MRRKRHDASGTMRSDVVSVIIPVYNGAAVIGPCLEAVFRQELPRTAYEVLVVDNGSTDGTVDVVRRYPVRLATESVRSSYAARNTGVRLARGRVLAFTDQSCRPSPRWLSAAFQVLTQGADAVGGHIQHEVCDPRNPWERYDQLFFLNQALYVARGWAATANLIVSHAVFERVGSFSVEESGDKEWGLRATAQHVALRYSAEACVTHVTRKCFRDVVAKLRRVEFGEAWVHRRNGTPSSLSRSLLQGGRAGCRRCARLWRAGFQGEVPLRAACLLSVAWPILEGTRLVSFCQGWIAYPAADSQQKIAPPARRDVTILRPWAENCKKG